MDICVLERFSTQFQESEVVYRRVHVRVAGCVARRGVDWSRSWRMWRDDWCRQRRKFLLPRTNVSSFTKQIKHFRSRSECHLLQRFVWIVFCNEIMLIPTHFCLISFLLHVGIAIHPWPLVSDIAIFVLKFDINLQLTPGFSRHQKRSLCE